jgi:V/A-type H+-transporting ATPase subunit I
MSIVAVQKVTFYGPIADKASVLEALQAEGVMHRIPLRRAADDAEPGPSAEARRALKVLLTSPWKRQQLHDASRFDAEWVQRRALEIESRLHELWQERDDLTSHIEALEPWGDFAFPPPEELGGNYFWFYVVPHYQMRALRQRHEPWEVVRRGNRFSYVVVLAPEEPVGMPVPRAHTGARRLSELRARLERVDAELEDLAAERGRLTRWIDLFARSLSRLEDKADRSRAAQETLDEAPLFAIQGWVPEYALPRLQELAQTRRLAMVAEPPDPDDEPPTLLDAPKPAQGGQDLVTFYMTPAYHLWDPSATVLLSFAVFFALILSDAGYALVLAGVVALFYRRMGRSPRARRMRRVFGVLIGSAAVWGVLAGSYFGLAPPAGSILQRVAIVDVQDASSMMRLSILIGVAHLVVANLAEAGRRGLRQAAVGPVGWAVALIGATALWLGLQSGSRPVWAAGAGAMGLGGLGVLAFSGAGERPLWRLLRGGLALAKVPQAFGDVLSYLRLFALGLATASLAVTFNDLAGQVAGASPGFGLLGALLVLVLGHGLNFALAVMSGFVHGLRLNYIEFFNWGLPGEGRAYRPFAKRET